MDVSAIPSPIILPPAKRSNDVDHVGAVERSAFDAGQNHIFNEQVERAVKYDEWRPSRLGSVFKLYNTTLECPDRAHGYSTPREKRPCSWTFIAAHLAV